MNRIDEGISLNNKPVIFMGRPTIYFAVTAEVRESLLKIESCAVSVERRDTGPYLGQIIVISREGDV